jgi:hypothetical protein
MQTTLPWSWYVVLCCVGAAMAKGEGKGISCQIGCGVDSRVIMGKCVMEGEGVGVR